MEATQAVSGRERQLACKDVHQAAITVNLAALICVSFTTVGTSAARCRPGLVRTGGRGLGAHCPRPLRGWLCSSTRDERQKREQIDQSPEKEGHKDR